MLACAAALPGAWLAVGDDKPHMHAGAQRCCLVHVCPTDAFRRQRAAELHCPRASPKCRPHRRSVCVQVAGGGALPGWVLATFLANCMQDISACTDAGRQSRHIKLLCACVALVVQRQPHALAESLPELLAFCIEVGAAAGAGGCEGLPVWGAALSADAARMYGAAGFPWEDGGARPAAAAIAGGAREDVLACLLAPTLALLRLPRLQQSRHKQAADLYRQLRGLEAAAR